MPGWLEPWILLTLAAAFLQNLRSVWQKQLSGRLSLLGATSVRFTFALPLAWLLLAILQPAVLVPAGADFWFYAAGGALAQIAATWALLRTFAGRGFAVGTTLSKTEVLQTVLFAWLLLGEGVSLLAATGIAVSLLGVILLSLPPRTAVLSPGATPDHNAYAFGLLAGSGFALSAVCYRGAALSVGVESFLDAAAVTLAWVLTLQSVLLILWLGLRDPVQLRATVRQWRRTAPVGMAGMLASLCWFSAMTLHHAAYVRALGQVELLFAFVASLCWFRERIRPLEWIGACTLVGGILLLIWP